MTTTLIRCLTAHDLELGMRLKSAAGWNQLEGDWRRVLALEPTGCFVAEIAGVGVGTVVTTVFQDIAWISMMLVDEAVRGRGIGKLLMCAALEYLDQRGVRSVRLDATPLGRPLYEKLGFKLDFELARFAGKPVAREFPTLNVVERMSDEQLHAVAQLDQELTATDRSRLLWQLWNEARETSWSVCDNGKLVGFQMQRCGANATQIGPCLGSDSAGQALLASALNRHHGLPVFVDIPLANSLACELVQTLGLLPQRPLYRMTRGPQIAEQPLAIWGSFGPEKG